MLCTDGRTINISLSSRVSGFILCPKGDYTLSLHVSSDWMGSITKQLSLLNVRYSRRGGEICYFDAQVWQIPLWICRKQLQILNRLPGEGCDTAEWYKTIKSCDLKWLFTPSGHRGMSYFQQMKQWNVSCFNLQHDAPYSLWQQLGWKQQQQPNFSFILKVHPS